MLKKIVLISALSFLSCSAFAAEVLCPLPETITTDGQIDVEDGIPGFVYCSPSESQCKWKGLDPLSDQVSPVATVNNKNNIPTKHNGLTYCDYTLKNGNQIRLALEK